MKKICRLLVMFLILLIPFTANADEKELKVIEEGSEIELENEQGFFTKKISSVNSEKGEVIIDLELINMKERLGNGKELTEIFLVIDNSPSMDFVTPSGKTRKEIIIASAKKLVESVYSLTSNVKIGIVDFHGLEYTYSSADLSNAHLVQTLTNDKQKVLEMLEKQDKKSTVSGTNIDAGLKVAYKNFTGETENKIIVLLSDGNPNADASGNHSSNDVTEEKALVIQENTNKTIKEISKDTYVIAMLTGISEEDGRVDKNGKEYERLNTVEEELVAVERVFGTKEDPASDKYYLVTMDDVENTITKDILSDIKVQLNPEIKNIVIEDFFPKEIIDNFKFELVETPNFGIVDKEINSKTNSIIWKIDELKGNEIAKLSYKLIMKDMQNKSLLNKEINTNQKVNLSYTDKQEKEHNIVLEKSPKIVLKLKQSSAEVEVKENNPKTDIQNSGLIIIIISILSVVLFYIKTKKLSK